MDSYFIKLFEVDTLLSHSNQSSSLPFKLTDGILCEENIGFKWIKSQFYRVKLSIMKVGSGTTAISKMGLFVTIVKGLKL